jgi:Domain of unknown function (DUF4124)
MRNALFWLAAAAVAVAPAAQGADVYKWTDARGGAGYGDKVPAGARNVTRLTMDAGNVSIIPLPKPLRPAAPSQPGGDFVPPTRVDSLVLPGSGPIGTIASWRRQCQDERRVDCDNPTAATFDVAPSFARSSAVR